MDIFSVIQQRGIIFVSYWSARRQAAFMSISVVNYNLKLPSWLNAINFVKGQRLIVRERWLQNFANLFILNKVVNDILKYFLLWFAKQISTCRELYFIFIFASKLCLKIWATNVEAGHSVPKRWKKASIRFMWWFLCVDEFIKYYNILYCVTVHCTSV